MSDVSLDHQVIQAHVPREGPQSRNPRPPRPGLRGHPPGSAVGEADRVLADRRWFVAADTNGRPHDHSMRPAAWLVVDVRVQGHGLG